MTKKDKIVLFTQVGLVAALLLIPGVIGFSLKYDIKAACNSTFRTLTAIYPFLIVYFTNFYVLCPKLLERKRYGLFLLANIGVIALANVQIFFTDFSNVDEKYRWGIWIGIAFFFVFNLCIAALATGIRSIMRINEMKKKLKEEQQKNTEAELSWLKNQLNPHFLFNTLNNISGLIQINPDAAQDSIAKLSDLLRYTLYESNRKYVSVREEIEFMQNYIDLMKLRCGPNTTVETSFHVQDTSMQMVPLLFVSLIENAFKHGVSSNKPSFVRIRMSNKGRELIFTCQNSNYPKDDKNRSGSGIGIENMKRRLELLYKDSYNFKQTLEKEIYQIQIYITCPS